MLQAAGPSTETGGGQCAVTIDYEAKLLQGSGANASSLPFVGSLSIQNTSPAVRSLCPRTAVPCTRDTKS